MSDDHESVDDDPVVRRLFRYESGLRRGGTSDRHEVLATYTTRDGDRPFAFCRDGLLIDPEGRPRFIAYADIEETSYGDFALLMQAKATIRRGEELSETLPIRLVGGEVIELPLEQRGDGMSERWTIAGLLEQRVRIFRMERSRQESGSTGGEDGGAD